MVRSIRRFYDIQYAFSGSASQAGPFVDLSKAIMGAKFASKHGQAKVLDRSTCSTIPGCKVSFLDSQINGAVFMLQRSCGTVPITAQFIQDEAICKAASDLKSCRTWGGFVLDTMGFGKTYMALLFLNYYAMHARPTNGYRPHLIVVPSGIVLDQWIKAIYDAFPDLTLILAHGERPHAAKYAQNWISATAMREAPASLTNFPSHLTYIFDKSNPTAAKTVLLTSPETLQSRTLQKTVYMDNRGKQRKKYSSRFEGIFEVVLLDEGHRFRYTWTRIYAAVKHLNADIHWFLTGTPIQNNAHVC
jgi:hypothetical protein